MHPLVEKVHRYIQDHHLLQPPQRVLVGVSGGADSVALLLALLELVRAGKLDIELFVAHLEHGIRGQQSRDDAEFVRELAKKLDLPFMVEAVDVPDLADERKLCLESAGRSARYDFFSRTAQEQQCSVVALAHHGDDQAETILHRIIRGTGLTGLAGIRPCRLLCRQPEIHIVRPLLSCHRVEIEQFLTDMSVSWRTDHTNLGLDATRSRIRNELLPSLRDKYNPRVDDALLKLAAIAEHTNDFLDEHTVELFDRLARTFGSLVCVDLPGLAKSHRALQTAVIRYALLKLDLPQRDMSFDTIDNILARGLEHLSSSRPDRLALPGPAVAVYEFGRLLLSDENSEPPGFAPLELPVPGQACIPELNLTVSARMLPENIDPSDRISPNDRTSELIDRDAVHGRLVLRPPEPAETFEPLGGRSCTMAEFLLSCKIPRLMHPLTCILADQQGPLWVVSQRLAQRARITDPSKGAIELSCC